jgi:hypothetical protein
MKIRLFLRASAVTAILSSFLLASCASPQDTERLQRIGDIALTYAERTGRISPEDAALAREAGALIVSKDTPATVVVPSGK